MLGSRSLSVESVAMAWHDCWRSSRYGPSRRHWSWATSSRRSARWQRPTLGDLFGFGCAFTIAGAVAASVVLVLGGKRRWAVEIALAVGLTIATTAVLAYLALWAAPWTVRSRMDAWSFLRLQRGRPRLRRGDREFPRAARTGRGRRGRGDRGKADRHRPPPAATGEMDRPRPVRDLRSPSRCGRSSSA